VLIWHASSNTFSVAVFSHINFRRTAYTDNRIECVVLQQKSDKTSTEHTVEKRVEKRPVIHHESIDHDDVSSCVLNAFSFVIR